MNNSPSFINYKIHNFLLPGPVYKRQRRMSDIYSKLENSRQNETNFLGKFAN